MCETILYTVNNGHCDDRYNTEFYDYDGGDCCGSTCRGACETTPLETVFGIETNNGRSTAINNVSLYANGYPNCRDPEMVPVVIAYNHSRGADFVEIQKRGGIQIKCGETTYLDVKSNSHHNILGDETEYCFDQAVEDRQTRHGYALETVYLPPHAPTGCFFNLRGWFDEQFKLTSHNGTEWELSIIQENVLDGRAVPGITFQIFTYYPCLLKELDKVGALDKSLLEARLGEEDERGEVSLRYTDQALALNWMNHLENEIKGSVCGTPWIDQQYAISVFSFSQDLDPIIQPTRHCFSGVYICSDDGAVLAIYGNVEIFITDGDKIIPSEIGLLHNLSECRKVLFVPDFCLFGWCRW